MLVMQILPNRIFMDDKNTPSNTQGELRLKHKKILDRIGLKGTLNDIKLI